MKFYVALLVLKGCLLACGTEELDNTDQQEVINPNPPVSHTYSCAEQEVTCGKDTDRYYELVAGYFKYWIPNFPRYELQYYFDV
jgi:hypothetical protein